MRPSIIHPGSSLALPWLFPRCLVRGLATVGPRYYSTQPSPEGPEPTYSKLVSGYQVYHHPAPFKLDYGQHLPSFDLAYEVWGKLSDRKDNVILLHTGLSASSHAKSHPENQNSGWWEKFIGHGPYPIDLDRYFVICTNVLGSCYGSTGPHSINPLTGHRYATDFPIVSIFDMVRAQFKLLDHLGIHRLYASIGSSMGGMQSIAAAWLQPERVGKVVSVSGCGRSAPSSIAMRYAQRSVLMADPNWNNGSYYDSAPPHVGMKLARQIATITYRSGPEWEQRFGRRRRMDMDPHPSTPPSPPTLSPDFLIESYLDYQGEQFCLKYDANSLLYVSKAMDLFDMTVEGLNELKQYRTGACRADQRSSHSQPKPDQAGRVTTLSSAGDHKIVTSLARTFQRFRSTQQFLILGVQTDILFPIALQRELAEAIRSSSSDRPPNHSPAVTYFELHSPFGHDTFLIDLHGVGGAIRGFLS
ncbi:hypothetical protein PCANC_03943 [Puccinia coronata f. sp. avenae]|uniref:AB hydrolase-1 domain-containing protein n=1 Tax=Puccinia coronata f. sp. avenae TaxID=200324 RepID=A0A2N5W1D6_9BASI|nr:hypothetical protein PCANC_03943 [Puccinia coronata f. sp. avenae]